MAPAAGWSVEWGMSTSLISTSISSWTGQFKRIQYFAACRVQVWLLFFSKLSGRNALGVVKISFTPYPVGVLLPSTMPGIPENKVPVISPLQHKNAVFCCSEEEFRMREEVHGPYPPVACVCVCVGLKLVGWEGVVVWEGLLTLILEPTVRIRWWCLFQGS